MHLRAARTSPGVAPCSLHLGAEPASIYREYAPPPALRSYLICAWTLQIRAAGRRHHQRVLPDGCSDIIWIGEAPPIVVGPMTLSALSISDGGTTLVGLRFRPGAAARVLGVPAHELTDRHVPLGQLWRPAAVGEASERLLEQRSTAGRVAAAQSLLESRRNLIGAPDPVVRQALSIISAARHTRVDALARNIGISERQLHRRFVASVGYNPKMFQRVLRFQRLLALATAGPSTPFGHVAQLAGYADQAHMAREVREFAGVTPSAVLRNVVSALALSDYRLDHTASS